MAHTHRFSYAQARLFLGISNVGFWVCLAAVGLWGNLVELVFPVDVVIGKSLIIALAKLFLGYAVLQAPFDWLGGYILPQYYRRYYGDFSDFVTNWLRGVSVQLMVFTLIALSWIFLEIWAGWIVLAWMVLLLTFQLGLAWLLGCFFARGENGWKSQDDAFTGGIGGLPGWQKPIYVTGRGQRLRMMDERRRHHLQKMALPVAGVIIAIAFNLIGIIIAVEFVRHPLQSVAGLAEMILWFTLWSFVGLLVLPSMSRPAVYAGDYALYAKGLTFDEFATYLRSDPSQAGEESRGAWVERIFHPVPSPENRLARWGKAPGWAGGWHAARYAIYLSWAGLSLLNRAVHCNIGKPNVWVLLPCD